MMLITSADKASPEPAPAYLHLRCHTHDPWLTLLPEIEFTAGIWRFKIEFAFDKGGTALANRGNHGIERRDGNTVSTTRQ